MPNQPVTLRDAVELALSQSPELRAAQARLGESQGRLRSARVYPHNPSVQGQAASRRSPDGDTVDFRVSLKQEIELARPRQDRIATARAELSAQREQLLRAQRILAARVHLAFVAALQARELLEVARQDMELAQRLHTLAQLRLERGAGTQLDVNVAAAELGRAEARYQSAEAASRVERAVLAQTMGLEPTLLPRPRGELHVDFEPPAALDQVVEAARTRRADLQALRELENASRARLALARSRAWPNLTVQAFAGREEATDKLVGGSLSVPLVLFDRNQGEIAEARASIERTRAEREAGELSVSGEVVAAHARYEAGVRAAQRLRELVLGTLAQNLELLQRSFEAGKATWPEVVVIRRSLVDARRELAKAEANARRAWVQLQVAAGRMPLPVADRPSKEAL